MNHKIIMVPGLGFTSLLFRKLTGAFRDAQILEWMEPQAEEPIASYAQRLARLVETDGKPIVLLGHSFGGIMVQEMANFLAVEKVILVSSVKSREEIPLNFRLMAPLRLHKLFKKDATLKSLPYWGKYYGYDTPEVRELFIKMVSQQSNNILQWSLKALSQWEKRQATPATPIVQFHGECDKTFPIGRIEQPFTALEHADHLMIYKQAEKLQFLMKKNCLKYLGYKRTAR